MPEDDISVDDYEEPSSLECEDEPFDGGGHPEHDHKRGEHGGHGSTDEVDTVIFPVILPDRE